MQLNKNNFKKGGGVGAAAGEISIPTPSPSPPIRKEHDLFLTVAQAFWWGSRILHCMKEKILVWKTEGKVVWSDLPIDYYVQKKKKEQPGIACVKPEVKELLTQDWNILEGKNSAYSSVA